jgi:hypothetical protein
MPDDMIETIGPACSWPEDAGIKALRKDLATA